MRKNPDGPELLQIADQTAADLAANPDDPAARYKQAMINNARAIAERQAEADKDAGRAPAKAERDRLARLLGVDGDLEGLNRLLARNIRTGQTPEGAHAHLMETVRAELAESNPRYLAKLDNGGPGGG